MTSRLPRMLLALLAALALPLAAAAQQVGPRIDLALKQLISPEVRKAAAPSGRFDVLPTDAPLPLAGLLAVDRDERGRPQVGLFLEVSDQVALEALRDRGARVGTVVRTPQGGYLLTATVPLDLADSLTHVSGLVSISVARRVKVVNDSGVHAIHADEVRQHAGSVWTGVAGQGVIVGTYDTGIDFRHGDFLDGNGKTRLLELWDQTTSGTAPGGAWSAGSFGGNFSYGNLCTQDSIQKAINGNAASCTENDVVGHGTHVAGSAAGNGAAAGSGTQYQYAGVAPAADLIVVKGGNGSFSFNQIIDGVAWIYQQARALGKAAVVNLSLGAQFGPHDGTSDPERMLDLLARDSFAVVVAAGNDGSNGNSVSAQPAHLLHAGAVIATGQTQAYTFTVPQYTPNPGKCNDAEDIEIWYSGQDNLDFTIIRPDGSSYLAARGTNSGQDNSGGAIVADNASTGPNPNNGDNQAQIEINDCGTSAGTPAPGTWTIQVTGRSAPSGRMYHLWLTGGDLGVGGAAATGLAGFDNRYVVGTPGTAKSVITAGAFTSRTNWRAATGTFHFIDNTVLGDLADFSSPGPTRDGRRKPDIAAPGATVLSALSRDVVINSGSAPLVAVDGQHWAEEGTSMATPHVTGAIALMFQLNKSLTADQIRTILAVNATQDGFTSRTYGVGGAPQDWWGGGKLNVRAALAAMNTNPNAVAGVTISPRADTLVRGGTDRLTATVFNGVGVRLALAVTWTSSNTAVATVDATGLVRAIANGSAFIIAAVGAIRDSISVVVVPPSVLTLTGASVSPAKATISLKGTRVPLLTIALKVTGFEAMKITSLAFDATGNDPAARLVLFRDVDGSGTLSPGEPQVGAATAALSATATRVTFTLDSVSVPANSTTQLILAVEMSGQAPNGARFAATLVPTATHTLGVRSLATDQLGTGASTVASAPAVTTVLGASETFALSENPVHHGHVIFNFSQAPTVAAVYSLTGRRVVDLLPRLENGGRIDWKLTNDQGAAVAPGIYLVVFNIGGQLVRQKLFIATTASAAGASPQE